MASQSQSSLPPHLLSDREIHVVISILSGQHKAKGFYEESLKPLLDRHGVTYFPHETKSARTIIELTEKIFIPNARRGVKQTIILLSGDGGIVDIVNTFTTILNRSNDDIRAPSIFLKPLVALIPMGTANALAWSSGVAQDALKVLMEGKPQSLPSYKVRFSPGSQLVVNEGQDRETINEGDEDDCVTYGAVVCSWGLHASLVAMSDTAEYRKHGVERFRMAAGQLLKESHSYRGKIKWRTQNSDWIELPAREHSYILTTMVSNLEENFKISPATTRLDGTLRMVILGVEPAADIMRVLGLAYQSGQHVNDPKVMYENIEGLRIEFDEEEERWRQVCVDGKIVAVTKDGYLEVTRIPATGMDARRVVELIC